VSVWYIKEYDGKNNILKKLKNVLNIIEIKNIDGKVFCKLPINNKTKDKKIKTLAKKLNAEMYRECIETVVLSDDIINSEVLKKELYQENINILDGRKLFQFLALKIIKYIYKNQNKSIEEGQISILVNDNTDLNIETILEVAKEVKRINIVTSNIKKFKNIEEYLYNELRNND